MSQNNPKTTSLTTSVTKTPQHPTKNFFSSADSLEPLNSSLAQLAKELWCW